MQISSTEWVQHSNSNPSCFGRGHLQTSRFYSLADLDMFSHYASINTSSLRKTGTTTVPKLRKIPSYFAAGLRVETEECFVVIQKINNSIRCKLCTYIYY